MRRIVLSVLGVVLCLGLSSPLSAQFVAFNDFYRATETHANATEWNGFGTAGSSGLLKDIYSGVSLGVTLTITNGSALEAGTAAKPNAGTPAYNIFNTPVNYIDWTNSANNAIQLQGTSPAGNTLSGLNPSRRYRVTVTGVRGGSYADRWTTFDLVGAGSYSAAHSAGCYTNGTAGIPPGEITSGQAVINTGHNLAGEIASWDNIDPGSDGNVTVLAWTYRGTIPGGSSAGSYGYGIHAMKVEEYIPVPTPVSFLLHPQNRTVDERQSVTFSALASGNPSPSYQWHGNGDVLPDETNSTYTIPWVSALLDGTYYYVVAQNTVTGTVYTAQSSNAFLTVNPDETPPGLVGAFGASTLTNVTVLFNEPVTELTATNISNYRITNYATGQNLRIYTAQLSANWSNVFLTTTNQITGATYVLIVNGVTDRALAANEIVPNSTVTFQAQGSFVVTNFGGASPQAVVTLVSNGINVVGGGADIGGTSDSCQFLFQNRNGDFDVQVRVAGVSLADIWSKAALMARANPPSASAQFAAAVATPSMSGCFFQARATSGGTASAGGYFPINYPYTWLRLQRTNLTTFIGYASADGASWFRLGSATINMGDPVAVGLALSSRTNGLPVTAQFRDFGDVVNPSSATYWSMPNEPLGPSSRKTCITISEIMYRPAGRPDGANLEFIELYNSNPYFEELSGWRISGDVDFTFPSNTVMQGGTFLVLAREPAALQANYYLSNVVVMGPYTNSLKIPGTVRLRDDRDAIYLEVNYTAKAPWPVGADGTGHSIVLARPSYGEGQPQAWDISDGLGGSPGAPNPAHVTRLSHVVINEFLANTGDDTNLLDYIELYNHSSQPVDITGCILTDNPQTNTFVIPSTTIGAHGFVVFYRTNLNFGLEDNGETFYLKAPEGNILGAVRYDQQGAGIACGRSPDGAGQFYLLSSRTPGAPNSAILVNDIVINEIMYDSISNDENDQYVELYNRGTNSITLDGWKFADGINFTFPSNTVIPPDSYLVVAKNLGRMFFYNPHLNANNTVGPFSGSLAGRGERLALAMIELETNYVVVGGVTNTVLQTNYVVVDEVTYGIGGNWPKWANQGGSSLELIDPMSNHRLAHNWASSDETAKAPWTTIQYTGPQVNGSSDSPGWIEILALEESEFLVDNVQVRDAGGDILSGDRSNFDGGLGGWANRGTHIRSTWEADTGVGGTGCLHVRAQARGDTMGNRSLAQLPRAPSGDVTITAQVRWLCGFPELYIRLRGNWAEATGRLQLPTNPGTPGLANSRRVLNSPPAIYEVRHFPVIPLPNQAVVVTARAHDVNGLSAVVLKWRVDPTSSSYTSLAMVDDGTVDDAVAGDGIFSASIPGQSSGTMIAFKVEAADTLGAVRSFPIQDPTYWNPWECLVRFDDPIVTTSFGVYRQWLTQANLNDWQYRPSMSNEKIYETFVYGNFRAIHNARAKWSGSPYHQYSGSPTSVNMHYALDMPEDDLLLGTASWNKIHAPGNNPFADETNIREQTCYWFVRKLGAPWNYRRFVNMFINGNRRGGTTYLMEDSEVPGGDVIESRWPDDTGGSLFKLQPWFEQPDFGGTGSDGGAVNRFWCTLNRYTRSGVHDLARYRQNYLARRSRGSINETFTNVFALVDAASTGIQNNYADWNKAFEALVDTEEWLRIFAVEHAVGNWDSFGNRNSQNMYGYKPERGKWALMIWDLNIVLGHSGSDGAGSVLFQYQTADANMPKFYINNPTYRRAYWRAMKELCNFAMVNANCDPFMDGRYYALRASGINVTDPAVSVKGWIASARSSILSQIAAEDATSLGLTATNITISNNWVTLSGMAPVEMKTLKINGVEYPGLTWNNVRDWTLTLRVNEASNVLSLQGYSAFGGILSNLATTAYVVNTGMVVNPLGNIVINEIMYKPTNSGAAYVEIYNRSTNFVFNISGWHINGLGNYTFPGGSYLSNGQHLVIAKDLAAYAIAYPTATPAYDTFDGNLDLDGETLTLIKPARTTNEADVVIDKVRYETRAPWPSIAPGTSLQVLDNSQDNSRVGDWAGGSQWRYFSATGNPGTNSILYIYPDANGCDLFLDDIRLVMGTNGIGENLLRNGDFESGSNTFWNIRSSGSTATNLVNYAGDYSFHLISASGGSATFSGFNQNVTNGFVRNTNYTLSYWYLANYRGSNLWSQMGLMIPRFRTTNSNIGASPYSPGAANSVKITMPEFPPLWLNEVQPKNVNTRTNRFGQFAPWVELYNPSTNPVELTGLYLANNYTSNMTQWAFPTGSVINPGEFKLIWLDAAESNSIPEELHANFTIPESTGSVALVRIFNSLPQVVDYLNYSGVGASLSYGDYPDGQPFSRQIFYQVTPAAANNAEHPILFINEWVAVNSAGATNGIAGYPNPAGGNYDDWFELYNPNDYPVNLANFFLTDTNANPTQYRIPPGYSVPANGFLVVWADNSPGRNTAANADLHVNFNLNQFGEQLGLYDPNTNLIDSISFGSQTNNISQGRYGDGALNIYFMSSATPGQPNLYFVNTAPALMPVTAQVATIGQTLWVTNVATDAEVTSGQQTLSWHLAAGAPPGTYIYPSTGTFRWTPMATGSNWITIWVEDNGLPRLTATTSFTVVVQPTNSPPSIPTISNQVVSLGQTLSLFIPASDPNSPPQMLTFSLDPGFPTGADIDPVTGQFTWTPLAGQVPSTNSITVRVTDDGTPHLSATRSFIVFAVLASENHPPVLGDLSDQIVLIGQLISFTVSATDPDSPAQVLTFSLDPGAPAGASIDSNTGLFAWTPTNAPSSTNITVRVTDDGTPPLSASGSFNVTVLPMLLSSTNDGANIILTCQSVPGRHYQLQYTENISASPAWQDAPGYEDILASGDTITITLPLQTSTNRFYHVQLMLP